MAEIYAEMCHEVRSVTRCAVQCAKHFEDNKLHNEIQDHSQPRASTSALEVLKPEAIPTWNLCNIYTFKVH